MINISWAFNQPPTHTHTRKSLLERKKSNKKKQLLNEIHISVNASV